MGVPLEQLFTSHTYPRICPVIKTNLLAMKTPLLAIVLMFSCHALLHAQDSDYKLVEQAVNYYLEGGTNNDFEMLKKAFHEDAMMKYMRDGAYTEVNAIEFFGRGMDASKPPQNRETRVAEISVSGHAASARLEIEYPTFMFVDYMNLLKIDGEWKIVNKIFYRQPKSE